MPPYRQRLVYRASPYARVGGPSYRAKPVLVRAKPAYKRSRVATQVRRLLKGKTKDSENSDRNGTLTTTTVSLLTSNTNFATAVDATGVLSTDQDCVTINSATVRGMVELQALEDVTPVGISAASYRTIIVMMKKPLTIASAAATLPPITEVLQTDSINSLYVESNANSGRFTVLYDKTVVLGTNTVAVAATGAYPRQTGPLVHIEDIKVPVNKMCYFKDEGYLGGAGNSGSGGHYDSDTSKGQVSAGLLLMYTLSDNAGEAGTIVVTRETRINYTG